MSKKGIAATLLAFMISLAIMGIGSHPETRFSKLLGINLSNATPRELYRVYLAGDSLGVIESRDELEKYIDSKQEAIKNQYKVDKVYAPNDLKIVKEITYNEKISSIGDIYNKIEKIKGNSSFTVDGYSIEIKGLTKKREGEEIKTEDQIVYVIDKKIWDDSVNKTVTAFIDEDRYNNYINDTQKVLAENETGSTIKNLYIENKITITKGRIPAEGNIYTTEEELSKFLLFGTKSEEDTYVVKAGDTIADIANDNKLSVQEFLIANSDLKSADDLLYPGQTLKIGLISPQFDLVQVEEVATETPITKNIVYKDDNTKYVGYEKVEEEGSDGLAIVTSWREVINGEINESTPISRVDIVPAVDKVITRGTLRYSGGPAGLYYEVPVGIGTWVWPTNSPYTISSPFAWRWGKHHDAVDITGTGFDSPIKAANNGIVVESYYNSYNGNVVLIKHSNNYYTIYVHLNRRYAKEGQVVMANDVIGTMGMTGFATGVHLHFGVYIGYPFRAGSVAINPLTLYR